MGESSTAHNFDESSAVDGRRVEDLTDDLDAMTDLLERLVTNHKLVVKITD